MSGRIRSFLLLSTLTILLGSSACKKEVSVPNIITPPSDKSDTYNDCIIKGDNNTLEIATWNIEHFPKSDITPTEVQSIISYSEYDVWGVQEIEGMGDLKAITNLDSKYSVVLDNDIISGINRNYHLAFVYRNDQLELLEKEILPFSSSPFPRRPLMCKFKRKKDNSTFYIINMHLKAFGDEESEDRRREAARVLKEFIDNKHDNDKVFVVGDYNDVIHPFKESEFQIILNDTLNYKFSDMQLATSDNPREDFSYPGRRWLSHIDHILITNEIFSSFIVAKTLTLDSCSNSYDNDVSDHRPVVAIFN